MPRRWKKAKKAAKTAVAIGAAGLIGAILYDTWKPEENDVWDIKTTSGAYNGIEYVLWNQVATLTNGFSLGDSVNHLTFEKKDYHLTDNNRLTTKRELRYGGDAPYVRETQADSLLRALESYHYERQVIGDYKRLLDEYTDQLR